MPTLENSHHEAFAQARFAGKSLAEAHEAAGLSGARASASRLNRIPEVQERIAELFREAAAQTTYDKTHAVRDLLAVIHASPSDADEDHPLCEVRMGKDGTYHRLPPKLQAMSRLVKLMGWDAPVKLKVEIKNPFDGLLEFVRGKPPLTSPEPVQWIEGPSSSSQEPTLVDPLFSPERPASPATAQPSLNHSSTTSQPSLPPRHESFAQARVKGLGVTEAYHAAGFTGDTPNLAWRLNSMPDIKERIAQLNGSVEEVTGYRKDDAVRDLVAILRARPAEAGPDHPFCETRMTSWGVYHRFPSKLATLTLLARMLGWNSSTKARVEPDPEAQGLIAFVRNRS